MAIKTKYRIKNSSGKYDVIHFQTSADQVITNDEMQFVTRQEKEQLSQINKTYLHNQIASEKVWEIEHNLGKFPSVSIIDSAGTMVIGDVLYLDENHVRISFSFAFAGKAYLN